MKVNLLGLLTMALLSAPPKVGDVVPDFTATDTDGKVHNLTELLKEGPVIVAFFPKAFTPG